MLSALRSRSIYYSVVRSVFSQDLALEDPAVLQREMKNVPSGSIGHRIKPDHRRLTRKGLKAVSDASEIAVSTVQPPHAVKRRRSRHVFQPRSDTMQTVRLRPSGESDLFTIFPDLPWTRTAHPAARQWKRLRQPPRSRHLHRPRALTDRRSDPADSAHRAALRRIADIARIERKLLKMGSGSRRRIDKILELADSALQTNAVLFGTDGVDGLV